MSIDVNKNKQSNTVVAGLEFYSKYSGPVGTNVCIYKRDVGKTSQQLEFLVLLLRKIVKWH